MSSRSTNGSGIGVRVAEDPSTRRPLVLPDPEVVHSLAERFQLTHLLTRYSERPIWALFMFINGFVTIALLAGGGEGVCVYGAVWLFGLQPRRPAMVTGVSAARIGAAALSLASTGALMILLKAAHPPAGATTLIISLGIVTRPFHLLVIEIAVAVLTLQAIAINRLAGIDYPLWALRKDSQPSGVSQTTA